MAARLRTNKDGIDNKEKSDKQHALPQEWSLKGFVRTLFLVSRPGLWHFTALLYVLPAVGHLEVLLTWRAIVGLFCAVLPCNLVVYAMNDLRDVDIDAKNPRKGGMYGAQASSSDLKLCTGIAVVLTFIIPPFLISDMRWCAVWSFSGFAVNWLYNFGPQLSRVPILDMVCPLGYLLIIPFAAKVLGLSSDIGPFFWAYLNLGVCRTQLHFQRFDIKSDAEQGKRTTAGAVGPVVSLAMLFLSLFGEFAAATAWGCRGAQCWTIYAFCVLVLETSPMGSKETTLPLMAASSLFIVPMYPCLASAWQVATQAFVA